MSKITKLEKYEADILACHKTALLAKGNAFLRANEIGRLAHEASKEYADVMDKLLTSSLARLEDEYKRSLT